MNVKIERCIYKFSNGGIAVKIAYESLDFSHVCGLFLAEAEEHDIRDFRRRFGYNNIVYTLKRLGGAVADGNGFKHILNECRCTAYCAVPVEYLIENTFKYGNGVVNHVYKLTVAVKLEAFCYVSVSNDFLEKICTAIGYLFIDFDNALNCKLCCVDYVIPGDLLGCFNEFCYYSVPVKRFNNVYCGVAVNAGINEAIYQV